MLCCAVKYAVICSEMVASMPCLMDLGWKPLFYDVEFLHRILVMSIKTPLIHGDTRLLRHAFRG